MSCLCIETQTQVIILFRSGMQPLVIKERLSKEGIIVSTRYNPSNHVLINTDMQTW